MGETQGRVGGSIFGTGITIDQKAPTRYVVSTGQSGHAFHHHYDDMIEPWVDGVQAQALWRRAAIEEEARSTLILFP